MTTDPGSRDERVAARDAARRRISWWTAALAVGGLGGTLAIANEARLVAEDKAATAQLEQAVSVADDVLASGQDGDDHGTATATPTAAPTVASSTTPSRRAKSAARSKTRRVATSTRPRTARTVGTTTKAPVQPAVTKRKTPVLPTVKTSGS